MVLELYVWGPAFGLPSIDAQCLAAIAYLQQTVPEGKWHLIASSDPAASPINELPALKNGDIWIGGFRNIFHYVAQVSAGEWVLDGGLPEQASADVIAFSSLMESHGQPLLDLSLYVSSQNYNEVTRPLYTTIQPFPLPYLTPHAVRSQAKQRTAHLGLSSLDIDEEVEKKDFEDSIIPESLRRPKNTVSSLLHASPETNAQIRLHSLATDFLKSLRALKGSKRYFVSDTQISSLDCLALGYLSLMLAPDLPQPWLARTSRKEFPDLCAWAEDLRTTILGRTVRAADAYPSKQSPQAAERSKQHSKGSLPWRILPIGSIDGAAYVFVSSIILAMPGFSQFPRNTRERQHGGMMPEDATSRISWYIAGGLGCAISGLGLLGYSFARRR